MRRNSHYKTKATHACSSSAWAVENRRLWSASCRCVAHSNFVFELRFAWSARRPESERQTAEPNCVASSSSVSWKRLKSNLVFHQPFILFGPPVSSSSTVDEQPAGLKQTARYNGDSTENSQNGLSCWVPTRVLVSIRISSRPSLRPNQIARYPWLRKQKTIIEFNKFNLFADFVEKWKCS